MRVFPGDEMEKAKYSLTDDPLHSPGIPFRICTLTASLPGLDIRDRIIYFICAEFTKRWFYVQIHNREK
jgi:hypothetical protein